MKIIPYTQEYKEAVIALLDQNIPDYFAAEEKEDLIRYLENEIEEYFLVEFDRKIIGAGGINFLNNKTQGRISWDIIHPNYQGKGVGSTLLKYRIQILEKYKGITEIIVRTSQLAYMFYEKNGFDLLEIKKEYWAKGFDLYLMQYKI